MAVALRGVAEECGRPYGDGLTFVPLPLAEISARSGRGRNCGTVYAHVRALGGAVQRAAGQSGLLLDVAALEVIAESPAGRTDPEMGRRPRRDTPFAGAAGPAEPFPATPAAFHPTGPLTAGTGQQLEVVRDLIALVGRVVDLAVEVLAADTPEVALLASLLDQVGAAAAAAENLADDPRETSRTVRDIADDPRDVPRDAGSPDRREGGRFLNKTPSKNLPPSLEVFREKASRNVAEFADEDVADDDFADDGRDGRPAQVVERSNEEVRELIRPLVDLADRANLVGVTDIEGARRALAGYNDSQVRYGVAQTARLAKAGRVKSPLGWLITKARRHDQEFFEAPPPDARTPATPPPRPATDYDDDTEAEAAVTALEAAAGDPAADAQLAQLDEAIGARSHKYKYAARPGSSSPAVMHTARVLEWRHQHPRKEAR